MTNIKTQTADFADVDPFELADQAARRIRELSGVDKHDVALVLGSGWGDTADRLGETVATIDNEQVPGFAKAAVAGHKGTMRSIRIEGTDKHALVYGTRTHYYEGRGVRAVVHGVRTAKAAGCDTVVLTNGCGGLNPDWTPGTPVLISDHLNLTANSPLEGATFVDLTDLYSSRLRELARTVDPDLPEGVYAQFRGPHYETPAEVQMAKVLGADLVGMSTALEAIAARHVGLEVLGISLVTNAAAGISEVPLSHEEVIDAGKAAASRCADLLSQIVRKL
ncbi:purine-nucleoside phosphorylase [Yimella sp. RIT 621]|uniref:purine-nucleoside phosphorylase n=1 Tax=Yimella sp. RIT 621 TaxID=2510323 RepID=UPI001F0EC3D4|nr:purine-nucleoside phosphorylase [Yimella sp. RIT 621]